LTICALGYTGGRTILVKYSSCVVCTSRRGNKAVISGSLWRSTAESGRMRLGHLLQRCRCLNTIRSHGDQYERRTRWKSQSDPKENLTRLSTSKLGHLGLHCVLGSWPCRNETRLPQKQSDLPHLLVDQDTSSIDRIVLNVICDKKMSCLYLTANTSRIQRLGKSCPRRKVM
jgi:hypothetical protein